MHDFCHLLIFFLLIFFFFLGGGGGGVQDKLPKNSIRNTSENKKNLMLMLYIKIFVIIFEDNIVIFVIIY